MPPNYPHDPQTQWDRAQAFLDAYFDNRPPISHGVVNSDLYELHLATLVMRRIQLARRTILFDSLRLRKIEIDTAPDPDDEDPDRIRRILKRIEEDERLEREEERQARENP
ncbi:hypothetical protein JW916_09910 [Candidatus Sumerlaeota bacterium]|nr:hypothetical protein [Candidatus Sumerlaeota bacterium]